MVRRVTPSQFQSLVRQAQQKQQRAISEYNSAVRQYNTECATATNQVPAGGLQLQPGGPGAQRHGRYESAAAALRTREIGDPPTTGTLVPGLAVSCGMRSRNGRR